jgi:hypothetical protein
MNLARHLLILSLFAATALSWSNLASQSLPKCETAKVRYTAFDPGYSNRILVEIVTDLEELPLGVTKKYSPQHTRWQARLEPNYEKEGPWTTTVYFGFQESRARVKLAFVNHANGGTELEWMNEKLVFGRVWWGRIYSTDFILDVPRREFVYREMALYGALGEPCR